MRLMAGLRRGLLSSFEGLLDGLYPGELRSEGLSDTFYETF